MRKALMIIFIFILFIPGNTYANEREKVKLSECIDGDTVRVIRKNKDIKVRLLAIDTPETNHSIKGEEPYGKEAKDFTCNRLKQAKKIEIEFDKNSDKKDKYDRYLVWLFYDNHLLQNELVKKGYAEVTYLYDDYKYTNQLLNSQKQAEINKKGIYSDKDNSHYKKTKTLKERIKIRFNKFLKKLKSNVNDLFNEILEEIV